MARSVQGVGPARRKQIAAAAIGLFKRQGFHKTSVREIADAAGLNVGTVYLYVKSKEEILYLTCAQILGEYAASINGELTEGSARERIAAAFAALMKVLDRYRAEMKLIYRESASLPPEMQADVLRTETEVRMIFKQLLADGVERGEIEPCPIDVLALNIVMFAHSWAIKGWVIKQVMDFDAYSSAQLQAIERMVPFTQTAP